MNSKLNRLLSTLFALTTCSAWAAGSNPPTTPPERKYDCEGKCNSGCDTSFQWRIEVGLARFAKPAGFTSYAQLASESDGNLPNFAELYDRGFSQDPL